MEEIKHRKFRGKNYTPEDEMVLLELVAEEKAVIQDPKSDAGTWSRKQRVWRDIEERFYLRTGNRRDYKALREKFITLKRQCRADLREKNIKEPKKGAVTELIVSMIHADSEKPTAEKSSKEKPKAKQPVEDSCTEIDTSMYGVSNILNMINNSPKLL